MFLFENSRDKESADPWLLLIRLFCLWDLLPFASLTSSPHTPRFLFHMECAASTPGSESHPEGKQLFHGQRFWMGGVVFECQKPVFPKNWKKTLPFILNLTSRCWVFLHYRHFAVPKGGFQVQISSVNILRNFFSVPKIQAIHHCQETAILFSSVGRL